METQTKITKKDVSEFKEYVFEHYGKDGVWEEFFPPLGASKGEINLAIKEYLDYSKSNTEQWGCGDTFDREIVRDMMFHNRGKKTDLEYQKLINKIVELRTPKS
jgi:hypothetical protein